MEPDSEVIAIRSLRGGAVSAPSVRRAVVDIKIKQQLKHNRFL